MKRWFAAAACALALVTLDARRAFADDDGVLTGEFPEAVAPGETFTVTITAKNTGNVPWSSPQHDRRFRPHCLLFIAGEGTGVGTTFQEDNFLPQGQVVAAGESYTWKLEFKAPANETVLKPRIQMVRHFVHNFGNVLEAKIEVTRDAGETLALAADKTHATIVLRSGEKILGDLEEATWPLATGWAKLEVACKDVLGLVRSDAGDRLYLASGEVLEGALGIEKLKVKVSGQTLEVPRAEVQTVAATVSAVQSFPSRTSAVLRDGCIVSTGRSTRWVGKLALEKVVVQTRFGELRFPLDAVESIQLAQEAESVDRVRLRNGDALTGVVVLDEVPLGLSLGPAVKIPRAKASRIVLAVADPKAIRTADDQRAKLRSGEILSFKLKEKLSLATAGEAMEIDPVSLDSIEATEHGTFRAVFRDRSELIGRAAPGTIEVELPFGGTARLSPSWLQTLENWRLPAQDAAKAEAFIKQLAMADEKQRDIALRKLVKLGRFALPFLVKLAAHSSAEVKDLATSGIEQIMSKDAESK